MPTGDYEWLVQQLPLPAAVVEEGGKILAANESMARIVGRTEARALVGQGFGQLAGAEDRGRLEGVIETATRAKDEQASAEVALEGIGGARVVGEVVARGIGGGKGLVVFVAGGDSRLHRELFNAIEDAIFVHDLTTGDLLDVNARACELYGYSYEELIRLKVHDISSGIPPYTGKEAAKRLKAALAGQTQRFEWQAKRKDGSVFWVEVVLKRTRLGRKEVILAIVRDITRRKEAQEQLALAAKVFESTIEGIVVTDANAVIQMVNPAFTAITGYRPEEVIGKTPRILRSNRHDEEFYRKMWESLLSKGHWQGEIWNRRKNGEAYPEWLTINAIKDDSGRTTHYVGVFHDITEIKRTQQKLTYQAYHDALTGLPNRLLLMDRLGVAVARAKRVGGKVAVLFMDLDRFKTINDTMGHAAGDMLLQQVARRLKARCRGGDTVARAGGDEFVIVLKVESATEAMKAAERLLNVLHSEPFMVRGQQLFLTASVGISIYPLDATDPDTMLRNADMAMYRAKEAGRGNYRLYAPEMEAEARERLELEQQLRRAIDEQQLVVYYQPKVELATGRVAGAEALVRWNHPTKGLLSPYVFIPLAEDTGLVVKIGEYVLAKACEEAKRWEEMGHPITLAVNLSPRQLEEPFILEMIERQLNRSGLEPTRLELEITETMVMREVDQARELAQRLRTMGVRTALDDFGTGWSSLLLLKNFPLDAVKIDQAFVRDLPTDPQAKAIASAVVRLAGELGLEVVAEGVETRDHLSFFKTLPCHYLQGYLFSPPVPADQFRQLIPRRWSL